MTDTTCVFMFGEDGRRWFTYVDLEEANKGSVKSGFPSAVSSGPGKIEFKHIELVEIGEGIFPNVKIGPR